MSWTDWIPAIIEGIGLIADKDDASRPDMPEPIDLEKLTRLLMVNSKSPFGNMTYSQGDNGQWTGEYKYSDEVQPAFDRFAHRAANPDQAYQMPDQLRGLQQALMNSRLGAAGGTPMGPSSRPPLRPYTPFPAGDGGQDGPAPSPVTGGNPLPPGSAAPRGANPGIREPTSSTGNNTARDPMGATRDPMGGASGGFRGPLGMGSGPSGGSGFDFNRYLNRTIPGAQYGSNPSEFGQFGIENAQNIGRVAGALTGIPGLGFIGNALANRYWQGHQWQNPASNLPQTGNDMLNEAIDGRSSPMTGEGRDGRGRGVLSGPAFGEGGGWYYDSSGQLRFARSGHVRRAPG